MTTVIRKVRATLTIHPDHVEKRFHNPDNAAHEHDWYQRIPWACPRLLDRPDPATLILARHPPAGPGYRPAQALADLLHELERLGIAHRDVHPGNIVAGPQGPLLIDWETGLSTPGKPSYDIHGPEISGVPVPDIHRAIRSRNSPNGYCMYWRSPHPASIQNQWGVDFPGRVGGSGG
ncbi:MAG: aminoglycoside phosphotransferase family protein [Actinomycetia bacterium]|nr:aminoglycoside phosphotransferase family protein [Actinomycetes bacterium]